MSIDLDKVILATPYNSFKNDGKLYTGTITTPTSCAAGAQSITTSLIQLESVPVFSSFYAYFTESLDLLAGNPPQWYDEVTSADSGVAVAVTAPVSTFFTAALYPVINGTQVTVTFTFFNSLASTATLTAQTIPFAFIEFSLAN